MQIDANAAKALMDGTPFSRADTTVVQDGVWFVLKLHNNPIVRRRGTRVDINDAGWRTNTTKNRINGVCRLLGVRLYSEDHVWKVSCRHLEMRPVPLPPKEWFTVEPGAAVEQLIYETEEIDK